MCGSQIRFTILPFAFQTPEPHSINFVDFLFINIRPFFDMETKTTFDLSTQILENISLWPKLP